MILVIFYTLIMVSTYTKSNFYERELEWWEETVFYQIYVRSYMDSDNDGIGDLNGIASKLEYLKDIGVGAAILSSIFQSPMHSSGHDISDFYNIHNDFGSISDLDDLIKNANEMDIKIILEIIPNHVSSESSWFKFALKKQEHFFDYFIWEDGNVDENGLIMPPNNWKSQENNSAWEYRVDVDKYYLHQFSVNEPDLNYRNPELIREMRNVFRYWLDKGIAGFKIDSVKYLLEADKEIYGGRYPDEPQLEYVAKCDDEHNYYNHIHTTDQQDSLEMVYQWRDIINEYTDDGFVRIIMVQSFSLVDKVITYFGHGDLKGAQVPMNFALMTEFNRNSTAQELKRTVDKFLSFKPVDKIANWIIGNEDHARVATKFGNDLVDGVNMLVLLLPGVAITYMGEEIGMFDGYISWVDTVDPFAYKSEDPINYWKYSRDPSRTPFQWNSEKNAGFSQARKTWLPVADNYDSINVERQKELYRSHLQIYKYLVSLRREPAFLRGRFDSLAFNEDIYAFKRWIDNNIYVIVINLRDVYHIVDLTYFESVSGELLVVISSHQSPKIAGEMADSVAFPVVAYEAVVVKV